MPRECVPSTRSSSRGWMNRSLMRHERHAAAQLGPGAAAVVRPEQPELGAEVEHVRDCAGPRAACAPRESRAGRRRCAMKVRAVVVGAVHVVGEVAVPIVVGHHVRAPVGVARRLDAVDPGVRAAARRARRTSSVHVCPSSALRCTLPSSVPTQSTPRTRGDSAIAESVGQYGMPSSSERVVGARQLAHDRERAPVHRRWCGRRAPSTCCRGRCSSRGCSCPRRSCTCRDARSRWARPSWPAPSRCRGAARAALECRPRWSSCGASLMAPVGSPGRMSVRCAGDEVHGARDRGTATLV